MAGIVAYWKLDESSGNAADASGNGYTGINTSVTYSPGKINNGGVFNGSSGVLKTTTTNISSNSFSVSAWVNVTNYTNHNNILRQENAGPGFIVRVERSIGNLRFYATSGAIDLFSASVIPLNQWYFLTVTGSPSGTKIYVNGVLDASNSQTATVNTTNLWMGLGDGGNEYFTGMMDEVGVWNRTLTASEVSSLYNSGNGLPYPF